METKHSDKRLIAGLLIILAGALVLAGNFFIDKEGDLYHKLYRWELIIAGVGVIALIVSENKGTGIMLIAVGGIFYLYREIKDKYAYVDFWQVFVPAIIILIGLLLIFRRKGLKLSDRELKESGDDYIDDISIFGGGDKIITSGNFKGGKVTAIFGGSNLNMTGVKLAEGTQYIDVFAVFGGFSMVVPEDWDIKIQTISIFGGFSDKHRISKGEKENKKKLILKGLVIFGGGEIKSF